MKIPPLLIGSLLIFWGVETSHLTVALLLALILESSHLMKGKIKFTDEDFFRISDLTSVVFITAIALILLNREPLLFFRYLIIWTPVIQSPLMIAQMFSTREKIIIGTKLGGEKAKKAFQHRPIDFRIIYIAAVILSTAVANTRSSLFFPAAALLLGWLLFANRGKGFSALIFLLLAAAIVTTGYTSSFGMEKVHAFLEKKSRALWRGYYYSRYADPYLTYIVYGNIGRLKSSGKILMRVTTNDKYPPERLVESSYNMYVKSSWHNRNRPFLATEIIQDGSWKLAEKGAGKNAPFQLNIDQEILRGFGLVTHPLGATLLTSPDIYELKSNQEGTLRAQDCAPLVSSSFHYTGKRPADGDPPDKANLLIPHKERDALKRFIATLWKDEMSKGQKLRALREYLDENFTYTLEIQDRGNHDSVIANFLLETRKGHCELFATATTLLLRLADIPTRYVRGYVVEEYSDLEDAYIVRARHAHAWCEAYMDGQWITVDTTPQNWTSYDEENAGLLEPVRDFFAYWYHRFKRFQQSSDQTYNLQLSALIICLSGILIFRIYRRMQAKKAARGKVRKLGRTFQPQDSPFFDLIAFFEKQGFTRLENETFNRYLLRQQESLPVEAGELNKLHGLHQKLRFDDKNFTVEDMEYLQKGVEEIIRSVHRQKETKQ